MSRLALEAPKSNVALHHPWSVAAAGALLLGLELFLFWDFFRTQVRWALGQPADWGHTLVIPLISGYFVYLYRDKLLAKPFQTAWVGLAPVIVGTAIYVLTSVGGIQAIRHHNLQGLGVCVTTFGLVLLLFGWRAMRYLWFPLLYLFVFGQPVSERFMQIVTNRLQDWTAVGSEVSLVVMGLDAERDGNVLRVFHQGEWLPLNIAEACSGMRMLMAFLALGVAMSFVGLKRYWQRALLVLMAVPVAVFVNILRVDTLALLSLVDSNMAAGDFHSFIGMLWLLPGFLIFIAVLWIIKSLVIEPESGTEPAEPAGSGEARAAESSN
jgi:exosortase